MNAIHPTTQYAFDVVYGVLQDKVCKWEKLACKRHLGDLERQGTEEFPYVFDETRADRIFQWFALCRHVRGPFHGTPIELLDWQKFDLGCAFGWVRKDTGARRFKISFEERARGNVKSTEKSGECLYFMAADCIYPPGKQEERRYEMMPEIECAAVDKDQAKRVWGDARVMALSSPDIIKRLDVKEHSIKHKTRNGYIRPLSKDTKNKDGGAPCAVIIDEYHEHSTSEIKDTLKNGFGKRNQSFMRIITTAGKDAENSPCKKEHDIAIKILEGEIKDETYFVMIRELDDGDDPHDKTKWCKPNPVLRNDNIYSRNLYDEIKSEHDLAYGSGDPDKIRTWLIKRVDKWQSDSEEKYMTAELMEKWKSLAIKRGEFLALVKGKENITGIDLSKTTDLTAAAHVFILDDGRFAVTAHGFMPEERAAQHEKSDRVPYKFWAEEGFCTLTPGAVTDYRYIKMRLQDNEFDEGWSMKEFCFDPYNASHFSQEIAQEYGEEKVIEIRQGVQTLSLATKRFRELVIQGLIVHDGNPLLTWCLSNAVEVRDNNENIKLSKKYKDDSQRIDLAAAIINAMVRAIVLQDTESVYEKRGLRTL